MSIEAMNWALNQQTGSASAKSVLLILANRANHNGCCWPGIDGIAEQTELSRRTVIRQIDNLAKAGLLTIAIRGGDGDGRKSNVYQLHIGQCATVSGQCATVSGQCATVTPEPKDKPSRNHQIYKGQQADRFHDFWGAYPKKRKKKPARDIWKRKKLDLIADNIVLDVLNRIENDGQWTEGYIPDPTTYLNQERWEDELSAPRSATKRKSLYEEMFGD